MYYYDIIIFSPCLLLLRRVVSVSQHHVACSLQYVEFGEPERSKLWLALDILELLIPMFTWYPQTPIFYET